MGLMVVMNEGISDTFNFQSVRFSVHIDVDVLLSCH